jgi:hypothetical protein
MVKLYEIDFIKSEMTYREEIISFHIRNDKIYLCLDHFYKLLNYTSFQKPLQLLKEYLIAYKQIHGENYNNDDIDYQLMLDSNDFKSMINYAKENELVEEYITDDFTLMVNDIYLIHKANNQEKKNKIIKIIITSCIDQKELQKLRL